MLNHRLIARISALARRWCHLPTLQSHHDRCMDAMICIVMEISRHLHRHGSSTRESEVAQCYNEFCVLRGFYMVIAGDDQLAQYFKAAFTFSSSCLLCTALFGLSESMRWGPVRSANHGPGAGWLQAVDGDWMFEHNLPHAPSTGYHVGRCFDEKTLTVNTVMGTPKTMTEDWVISIFHPTRTSRKSTRTKECPLFCRKLWNDTCWQCLQNAPPLSKLKWTESTHDDVLRVQ